MNLFISYIKIVVVSIKMLFVGFSGKFSEIKKSTCMIYPEFLSSELCQKLILRIDDIVETKDHPRVWRDSLESDLRIFGFEHEIKDLVGMFRVDMLKNNIKAYTGREVKEWFLMANRIKPKENNTGSGGGMHRDSPFSHQVKCIWYLSDVGEGNGPFQYVPGSNINLIKSRKSFPVGVMRFDDVKGVTEVCENSGTMLVCDTRCVHGGKPIKTGARYAVTLYTFERKGRKEKMFTKIGVLSS